MYDAIVEAAAEEGMKVTGPVGPMVKLPAALAARQQITNEGLPITSTKLPYERQDMCVPASKHLCGKK